MKGLKTPFTESSHRLKGIVVIIQTGEQADGCCPIAIDEVYLNRHH